MRILKAILTYIAICSFLLGVPFALAYLFLPEKLKTKSLDATLDAVQVGEPKKLPKVLGEDHAKMAEAASDPNSVTATAAPVRQPVEEVKLDEKQVEYVNPQTLDTINSLNIPDDLRNQLLQVYYSTGDVPGLRKPSSKDSESESDSTSDKTSALGLSRKPSDDHSKALHTDRVNSRPQGSSHESKKTLNMIEVNQQLRKIGQETETSNVNHR